MQTPKELRTELERAVAVSTTAGGVTAAAEAVTAHALIGIYETLQDVVTAINEAADRIDALATTLSQSGEESNGD